MPTLVLACRRLGLGRETLLSPLPLISSSHPLPSLIPGTSTAANAANALPRALRKAEEDRANELLVTQLERLSQEALLRRAKAPFKRPPPPSPLLLLGNQLPLPVLPTALNDPHGAEPESRLISGSGMASLVDSMVELGVRGAAALAAVIPATVALYPEGGLKKEDVEKVRVAARKLALYEEEEERFRFQKEKRDRVVQEEMQRKRNRLFGGEEREGEERKGEERKSEERKDEDRKERLEGKQFYYSNSGGDDDEACSSRDIDRIQRLVSWRSISTKETPHPLSQLFNTALREMNDEAKAGKLNSHYQYHSSNRHRGRSNLRNEDNENSSYKGDSYNKQFRGGERRKNYVMDDFDALLYGDSKDDVRDMSDSRRSR
uniref:Uncharacterized protein n=1 Tax=Polytomella parva TaxID=51329 RepID=A0A7S0UUY2_9CHLO